MEGRGGPCDGGRREGAVDAGVHLGLHAITMWGASGLILVPHTGQQQRIKPGIQCCRAVGGV